MGGSAPDMFRGRVVSSVVIWILVVCILGIPVAPQEMRAKYSVRSANYQGTTFFTSPAVVLLVFFSSDGSSLYSPGESHAPGLPTGELGSSLTHPMGIDALLGSTSLVPESPAWEPIMPNVAFGRLAVFPEGRRRTSPQLPSPIWLRSASLYPEYEHHANSPALTVW